MSLPVATVAFVVGLALVVYSSEALVRAVVGTSLGFGGSTFLISVLFLGFDPENLAVGAAASYEGMAGIALGTILGSAMVAIALAFGITALLAPMEFERASPRIAAVPLVATALLGVLALDGLLDRVDALLLLASYAAAVVYLVRLGRRGETIEAGTPRNGRVAALPPDRRTAGYRKRYSVQSLYKKFPSGAA